MNSSYRALFAIVTITLTTQASLQAYKTHRNSQDVLTIVDEDFEQACRDIEEVVQKYPVTEYVLDGRDFSEFSEEEMIDVIDEITSDYSSYIPAYAKGKLNSARSSLVKCLKEYRVTGIACTIDPNFAFILDQQNPMLHVWYKNNLGDLKFRTYQSYINSVGFKLEFAFKFNIMFLTDTAFNFYDTDKTIFINNGIDFSIATLGGLDFTYAEFANAPGGLVIVGLPLGISMPGISLVTDGYLQPIR